MDRMGGGGGQKGERGPPERERGGGRERWRDGEMRKREGVEEELELENYFTRIVV